MRERDKPSYLDAPNLNATCWRHKCIALFVVDCLYCSILLLRLDEKNVIFKSVCYTSNTAFQHNAVTTQEWWLTKEHGISKSYLRNVSRQRPLRGRGLERGSGQTSEINIYTVKHKRIKWCQRHPNTNATVHKYRSMRTVSGGRDTQNPGARLLNRRKESKAGSHGESSQIYGQSHFKCPNESFMWFWNTFVPSMFICIYSKCFIISLKMLRRSADTASWWALAVGLTVTFQHSLFNGIVLSWAHRRGSGDNRNMGIFKNECCEFHVYDGSL